MDEFLYRKIDIPNISDIIDEMRTVVEDIDLQQPRFLVLPANATFEKLPRLMEYFSKQGLTPTTVCLIILAPTSSQTIHIDYVATGNRLALNIPLYDCDNAYTAFYKKTGIVELLRTPITDLPYLNYIDDSPEEIDRYILDGPTILNVSIPHAVHNLSAKNRVCLSVRFLSDPWSLIDE